MADLYRSTEHPILDTRSWRSSAADSREPPEYHCGIHLVLNLTPAFVSLVHSVGCSDVYVRAHVRCTFMISHEKDATVKVGAFSNTLNSHSEKIANIFTIRLMTRTAFSEQTEPHLL